MAKGRQIDWGKRIEKVRAERAGVDEKIKAARLKYDTAYKDYMAKIASAGIFEAKEVVFLTMKKATEDGTLPTWRERLAYASALADTRDIKLEDFKDTLSEVVDWFQQQDEAVKDVDPMSEESVNQALTEEPDDSRVDDIPVMEHDADEYDD